MQTRYSFWRAALYGASMLAGGYVGYQFGDTWATEFAGRSGSALDALVSAYPLATAWTRGAWLCCRSRQCSWR